MNENLDALIALSREQQKELGTLVASKPDIVLLNYSAAAAQETRGDNNHPYFTMIADYKTSLLNLQSHEYAELEKAAQAYEKEQTAETTDALLKSASTLEDALDAHQLHYAKLFHRARDESFEKHIADRMQAEFGNHGSEIETLLATIENREANTIRFHREREDARDAVIEGAYRMSYQLEDVVKHPYLDPQINDSRPQALIEALENTQQSLTTFREKPTQANYKNVQEALDNALETAGSIKAGAVKNQILPALENLDRTLKEHPPEAEKEGTEQSKNEQKARDQVDAIRKTLALSSITPDIEKPATEKPLANLTRRSHPTTHLS